MTNSLTQSLHALERIRPVSILSRTSFGKTYQGHCLKHKKVQIISFNRDPNMIENSMSFFCRKKSCPTKHAMTHQKRASKCEVCLKYREKRIHIGYFKLVITSRFKCFNFSCEIKNILLIKKVDYYCKCMKNFKRHDTPNHALISRKENTCYC